MIIPARWSSFARPARAAALTAGLALAAGVTLAPGEAHAQRGTGVYYYAPRYDMPLGMRPVEPATEVGAEIGHTFFDRNRYGIVTRPYFGFRLRSPWEIYFTIPITFSAYYGEWHGVLGNIEVMAFTRFQFGRDFRMSLQFGGYAPTHFGFDGGTYAAYRLREEGMWSVGGYMPGYYTPGHAVAHFHLGFAWNPRGGIFTMSWEIGNELRLRVSNSGWYNRTVDASIFAALYLGFRVHRVVSVGGGIRLYDWFTQSSTFSNDEGFRWAGALSGLVGVRFHAGVFEPGVGVLFLSPAPYRDRTAWTFEGATIFADLRARWY